MPHLRVYEEAEQAIQEYKWIQSERAGRDLGADAELDWVQRNWTTFCRARLVRHLRGEVHFEEFGADCFGVLSGRFGELKGLLDLVLERLQQGAENLDLIRWGNQQQLPINQLVEVLVAADINRHRLHPPTRRGTQ